MNSDDYDHLPPNQRVKIGLSKEELVAECLKANGYELLNVTDDEDRKKKIDRKWVQPDGSLKNVQIKTRTKSSGPDILVDIYEPFFGIEKKSLGRDMIAEYDLYVCLSQDEKTVRVVDGKRQKEIISEILQEWADNRYKLKVFDSILYKKCQIRYHVDKFSKIPKILMFLNPGIYQEGTEIKYYEIK